MPMSTGFGPGPPRRWRRRRPRRRKAGSGSGAEPQVARSWTPPSSVRDDDAAVSIDPRSARADGRNDPRPSGWKWVSLPMPGAALEAHADHGKQPATEEAAMTVTSTTVDYDAIKSRQQTTWSAGDYAVIGTTLQITGESLCEAVDVSAGERVLDVAAGNGNASLAAARRGCVVTASDYVGALLGGAGARAA